MVTLARFGLTTGFLLGPADDRMVTPPHKQIFLMGNLCCQYTGCAWRRHPGLWTQASTALGDFVTLRLIRGCALGPLEASALGDKTSFPYC